MYLIQIRGIPDTPLFVVACPVVPPEQCDLIRYPPTVQLANMKAALQVHDLYRSITVMMAYSQRHIYRNMDVAAIKDVKTALAWKPDAERLLRTLGADKDADTIDPDDIHMNGPHEFEDPIAAARWVLNQMNMAFHIASLSQDSSRKVQNSLHELGYNLRN